MLLVLASASAFATTYTVTSTSDAGAGSLRAAITGANGAAGADTIRFAIAGAGLKTITLASALPTISGQLFIDGFTQSGSTENTTDPGSNAVLNIEINGNNAVATGFTITAANCSIRGLVMDRFTTNSINLASSAANTTITGCYFGTNASGTAASGTGNGVVIASGNNQIGGWSATERCLFSGATTNAGLRFTGATATNNYVRTCQFGLSADGTTVIGGLQQGIRFEAGANWNQVGETGCCYNRITGATGAGIAVIGAATDNNSVSGNMIWGNGGLGIDLGNDGVTANDGGDADTGPNDGQNFPVIQAAMTDEDGRVYVRTSFTGLPSTWYRYDYYANAAPDGSGYGEGQLWIGTRYAPTDGSGNLILHATAGSWNNIPAGTMISCTATQDGTWNTSEFSQNVACYYGRPIVTNTNDVVNGNTTSIMHLVATPGADGISLREAIMAANNNLDAWTGNYIYFDLPGAGPQTIAPTSPLPSLQTSTYLGGWNDPEYSTTPVVRINGSSAGAGANGLVIDNSWCAVYGISITNFNGNGILINRSNNEIMGCHIGVMPDGASCGGNGGAGVLINNSESNSLGNPWWGDFPNVIAGNAGGGVVIDGANAAYNAIRHSHIGVNVAGTAAICTQPSGIVVQNGAHDNTIGTDQVAKHNVIGGHSLDGIRLDNADDNIVLNNYCGTNAAGTAAIPNARAGIMLSDADGNEVGQPGNGNLASGNTDDGIVLRNSNGNVIVANYTGTRVNGLGSLPNGGEGITLASGSLNNFIGGTSTNERNFISGNNGRGLHISGLSNGNTVLGNYIGLDAAGADLGNVLEGIMIENANNNSVGGNTAGARNIISGNGSHGVYLQEGSSTNTISGNYIGTNTAGSLAVTNGGIGVIIRDGSNNTVGGTSSAEGNLISGNTGYGVMVYRNGTPTDNNRVLNNRIGTNAAGNSAIANTSSGVFLLNNMAGTVVANNQISGNTNHGIVVDAVTAGASIRGNLIGTNAAGTGALGNGQHGIWVGNSAANITIGGTAVADRNVICANGESGVNFQDLANNNTVTGNYIGIASNGTSDLGNTYSGVHVRTGATNMSIGGTAAGAGNVISGNNLHGINLEVNGSATVLGNYIGTNAAGTGDVGNTNSGIFNRASNITIGGATTAARNVISGNDAYGINIDASFGGGANNIVIGNYIGTNTAGTAALGNTFNGIFMSGNANRIGGTAAGEGNVISGSGDIGLRLDGATNTLVQGNLIGTNAAGTAALANLVGVRLKFGANNNTIGGTSAAARNIISGNGGAGLIIDGSNTNTVQGNHIGTNSAGALDLGNGSDGIRVLGAASTNTIGGTAAGSGNVISGNGNHGLLLNGSSATTVRGNIIGLRAPGDAAMGNDHDGIAIIASSDNIIGGSAIGSGNVISGNVNPGNSADGIYVDSGSGNTIQGNLIGTDVTGTLAFGNYYAGISNIANGTIIGGTNTGEGNTIRNNGSFGVRNQGTGVRILGNAIDANGGIGIDHNSDGVSLNDINDIDGGANSRQNFPVLTSATSSGGNTSITGTLNSTISSNYRIEFFSSPVADGTGYGEGATFLGSVQPISTDASGNATINANLTGITIPTGHYVTATATNLANNNTSEFSGALLSGFTISGIVFEDVNYGGGEGRDKATALANDGTGRPNARVELYDASGNFITSTLTNASGIYTFPSVAPADYQVRVMNSTVSSARTGYTGALRAVQTFATTVDNNVANGVTDMVGGTTPNKADAGIGSTTLAALQTATTDAQSLAWVTVDDQDITGVDFGFSFDVVVNTNDVGQGSLRQIITNANALGNDGALAQSGLVATKENVVFMISNGTAAPGLRAGNNYFVGGVATIAPQSMTAGVTRTLVLDATKQPGFVGTPIVELNGTNAGSSHGILLNAASNSVVRGFIINRFSQNGITLSFGSSNCVVAGNYCGTNAAGTAAQGNQQHGIGIATASLNNTIGGTNASDRNVLSGNTGSGVCVVDGGTTGNTIIGNYVGTNASGTASIGNFSGVYLFNGSSNTTVGGTSAGSSNLISGNGMYGVWIADAQNNTVVGNLIGTAANGTSALPNVTSGVRIEGGNNTIGGTTAAQRNVISGNTGQGVQLTSATSTGNTIIGNYIGVDQTGAAALANGIGMNIQVNATGNTIGGTTAGSANVISGNTGDGIRITNAPANTVAGNRIGIAAGSSAALANGQNGTRIQGPSSTNNVIGGTTSDAANLIYNNTLRGVTLEATAGAGNSILRNSISASGNLGIDLNNDGLTLNDANDADGGSNNRQNFPLLFNAQVLGATTRVVGLLQTEASKSYRIEFFNNPVGTEDGTGYGEGLQFMGTADVTTDATGLATIDETMAFATITGDRVTATATELVTGTPRSTSEFAMNVVANQPPVAICQNANVVLNGSGNGTITAAMINNGSFDPDGTIASLSVSPSTVNCTNVGTVNVTLTVTDNTGLTATCVGVVTVVDNIHPVISNCPSNITVNAGAACSATATWTVPTAEDNCAGYALVRTAGPAPGSTFPLGTTNVIYTATDASGNTANCSFTVTVVDVTAPVITGCPSNITVNAGSSCNATATWTVPSYTDNCAGGSIVRTTGPAPGSTFASGVTSIVYTATDAAGNISTCSFTVTVVDVTPPTYALCPGNQTINAAPGLCTALLPGPTFGYADNCSGTTNAQVSGTSISAPMPVGVHPVSFRLTDAAGNLSVGTCNFTVTVVDNQAPTALCQNVTVNLDGSGTAIVIAAQVNNGSTDNCAVTGLSVSPNSFTAVGTYPVVLTVTDAAGNTSTCNATVTVTDVNPPVAVCQNITIQLDASGNASIVAADIDGGSTDNGTIVSMVASPTAFDCSALGTNNVTLTVTDDGGNTDDCVAVVTVVDNIAPTATCQDITIQLNAGGTASLTAAQIDGGSTDNCTVASLSASQTNFDCTDLGVNTVTLTVTDQSGNQSTCNATVTVVDNILPQITCPANITVNNDAGICGAVVNYVAPVGTDNCAGSTTTRTAGLASGSLFPVGTTTVTYLVTDASGNTANCSFNVTVNDNEAPTLNCPANITVNVDAGSCGAVVNYPAPTANDNCGNATISRTAGPASGATFPLGTTVVAYEITHGGQTSSCFFTVTVVDNIAPTATCQNITIQLNAGGTASINAAQIDGGSTDNCTVASLSASQTNFDCTDLGANTVTLTVTDQSGNQSTCDATVTVVDNILPQIICPANITVNNDVNQCGAVVNYTAPVGTDNCAGSTTTRTAGLASGSLFPIGTTTVTYQVTDGSGNMANCSFTVTVNDTQNPAISCPANIVVGNDANQCGAVVNYVAPAGTDNCPGATTARTAGLASGSLFPLGLTTVTHQVTDASGNTAQCSFTVTVNDTQAPSITCPANVSAFTNAGCTATGVALGTPTTSDNCGVASVTNDAPAAFPLGSTTVIWTVTDNAGLTTTCQQTVTVTDNVDPVAVCQNISINLDGSGNASFVAADVDSGSTDDCAVTGLSVSPAGPFTAVGTYNVTLTVTDAAGNTDDCVAVVTVTDNNPPVALCQPVTIYLDASGNASIVAADIDGGSTDNGTIVSLVASQTAFDCSDLGTNNVTLTVTDDGGNTDDCIAVVTVVDAIDPSITCPADVSVTTNSGCTATGVVLGTPTSADNCSVASVTNNAPAAFPIGTTVVTWTVTDNSGNSATCTQNVTVTDASAPVIVACPSNISLSAGAACTAVATWTAPTVNDNCNGATITQTAGPVSGSAFPLGVSTITYTATDGSGNTSTCSFTVTVLDATVPVVVDCPSNISLNAGSTCTAVATWIAPTVTDNCSGATITQTAGLASGSAFPLGTSTITYTGTDGSGNSATCSFTVTVVDATAPVVVACPSNISLNAGAACTVVASWVAPTVADNCSGATITQTAGLASGSAFPLGTSTITYTATDGAGNTATCSFTVTVTDVTAPAIACPANIVEGTNAGICGAVVNYTTPVGTDNCSGIVTTMTAGLSSGSTFPVGTTTVTYLVTDAAGLTASCSFTVTVNDTEAPVAVCQNISINLDGSGNASFVAADVDGGSTDNCDVTGLSVSPVGPFTAVGTYNVTLTVTDAAGNTDDCVAVVTVTDNNPPVALCQPVTIYLDASGNAGIVAADIDGGSTDNGTIVSMVASQPAFDCSNLGVNNVTLTVTDDGGNTDDCVAVVTVLDTIAPTVICQNIDAFLDASGNVTITGADLDGGSSDNCGMGSLTFSASTATFDCSNLGPQTVSLTVTDASGNSSTCSATVTVQDTITPSIACNAATINIGANGWAVITASALATLSDNCSSGISTWTSSDSVNVVGDTTIWVYVQDITGNIDSCSATVTVSDSNPPVALCQPVTIYLDAAGTASIVAADIDGGSTDNGTIVSLVASQTSFDCSNLGANNVTLTVTDDGGNSDNCIAVVTVLDTIAPTVVCQNINAFLDASGNVTITGADLDGGSSDNCGTGSLSFTSSVASFSCAELGPQTVTLTVTDDSGNSSTCSATVTVLDTITPTIACSAASINIDANGWAIISANALATWNDNCSSGISTWVSTDSVNIVGDTTITVYVQDITGNIDSCSATVTVTDTNPPVAVCQNATIYLDAAGNASIVAADINGGSTDNGNIVSMVASQTAFDCSNLGTNNVTLTATDDGGNSDNCIAVVTVLDTIAPTISCHDISLYLDSTGLAIIDAGSLLASVNDNCGPVIVITSIDTLAHGGSYTVLVTVTDPSGNTSLCSSTVNVLDTIAPEANCLAFNGLVVYLDQNGQASITAEQLDGGSADNDSIASFSASQTAFDCGDIGSLVDTLFVMDAAGNISMCVATVIVMDTIAPTVSCQNITVMLDSTGMAVIDAAGLDNGSTDNCGGLVFTCDLDTLTTIGSFTATLTVTDGSGNSSICSSSISVVDGIAPVAICQPTSIYLDANGNASISASDIDGGSTDNATIASITASQLNFSCNDLGANNVTLTVTDNSGLVDSCTALVSVLDTLAPVVICQNITLGLTVGGIASITGIELDGGSSDNCGTLTYSTNVNSFDSIGTYTVVLTVTDASGNSSTCTATVTVVDDQAPQAICQPVTIYLDSLGAASITAADIDGGSTDNGSILSLTASQTDFDCGNIGPNSVTLTVTDDGGNSDNCVAVVTVLDTLAPSLTCQGIALVLDENGQVTISAMDLVGDSWDNCGSGELTCTATTTTWSEPGTYEVVVTVADASGNSSSCTSTVVVSSGERFVIPSGFSPNGDGIADTWRINGLPSDASVAVTVFNRWGDVVYLNNDYQNDWDGVCERGVGPTGPLPDGTYFYSATITTDEERSYSGYLQIAR